MLARRTYTHACMHAYTCVHMRTHAYTSCIHMQVRWPLAWSECLRRGGRGGALEAGSDGGGAYACGRDPLGRSRGMCSLCPPRRRSHTHYMHPCIHAYASMHPCIHAYMHAYAYRCAARLPSRRSQRQRTRAGACLLSSSRNWDGYVPQAAGMQACT